MTEFTSKDGKTKIKVMVNEGSISIYQLIEQKFKPVLFSYEEGFGNFNYDDEHKND